MSTYTSPKESKNPIIRFLMLNTSREVGGRELPLWRQLFLQILCLVIAAEVMFPIMYIITLSFSSKTTRPSSLELFPKEISFVAYQQVLDHPTANPVSFLELLRNSFMLSVGVGLLAVLIAVVAAYSFSRFKFKLRQTLMILVFVPLLMPAIGLATPLYLLMNNFRIADCGNGVIAIAPFCAIRFMAWGLPWFQVPCLLLSGISRVILTPSPRNWRKLHQLTGLIPIRSFSALFCPLQYRNLLLHFSLVLWVTGRNSPCPGSS